MTVDDDKTLSSDARFSAAERDPRFSRVPKKAKRAKIDDRFKGPLKDNPGFRESEAPVDKFGRPRRHHKLHNTLKEIVEEESESDEDGVDPNDAISPFEARASVYSDDSDEDNSDLDDFNDYGEGETEDIPRGQATSRIAVMGLDWSATRAVDIFASLDSFCPPGKRLNFVEVHPSKFGLERLASEAKFGPQVVSKSDLQVIQDSKDGRNVKDEQSTPNAEIASEVGAESGEDSASDEDDTELKRWKSQGALRKYEEERLKYFYAVVQCDDIKCADAVYEQCDGVEYAQSGRAFDLRFIPDDMVIETKPRDRADAVPDGYAPPTINPSSLNNSVVKLSWDADDPDRMILKKKVVGKQTLDEENLKAYLASSSEEDDAKPTVEEIELKKALLLGPAEDDVDNEEPELDMEIRFEPGMFEKGEEIIKKKHEKEEQEGETPWEARLRRQKERKAEKKRRWKEAKSLESEPADPTQGKEDYEESDLQQEDLGFSDPFFEKEGKMDRNNDKKSQMRDRRTDSGKHRIQPDSDRSKGSKLRNQDETELQNAELELLMMDSKTKTNGDVSMKEMLAAVESDDDEDRAQRRKEKKTRGRRRGQKSKAGKNGTPVTPSVVDTNDPRFQGLFDSHLYAMDPTHPKFRDNETTQSILKEKTKRAKKRARKGIDNEQDRPAPNHPVDMGKSTGPGSGSAANAELRQLASRLKHRAKEREKDRVIR